MAATNPGTSNLVEYYPFDDSSVLSSVEGIHANKTLTTVNTPAVSGTSKHGNAIDCTRTSEQYAYYDVRYDLSGFPYGDNAISISMWVRCESLAGDIMFITAQDSSYEGCFGLWYNNSTNTTYWSVTDGTTTNGCSQPSTITTNTWYHIVAYHDPVGNEIGLIINDGTPDTTSHSAGMDSDLSGSTAKLNVGRDADSSMHMEGQIDELAIFDDVLTGDEIEWLYNSGDGQTYGALVGNPGTGGDTVYYRNDNAIHYFANDGDFICPGSGTVDYLLVGGGGAGGSPLAGGGGGGDVVPISDHEVIADTYGVVVGAGGTVVGDKTQGPNGAASTFDGDTAIGGGGGGYWNGTASHASDGSDGASGGGGAAAPSNGGGDGGTGTGDNGYDGGIGASAANYGSGGGGGASEIGQNGSTVKGGDGGDGISNSILGYAIKFGAGGGGGGNDTSPSGAGGDWGGGTGGGYHAHGTDGNDTVGAGGGGGGGSGTTWRGGDGGNGIVIISYTIGSLSSGSFSLIGNVVIII
jgi:hypothetical protein